SMPISSSMPTLWSYRGARVAGILGPLLREATTRANLVPDAHLAALAIEHGLTLCSTDGDFAHFPGVIWQNPLRPAAPTP
ncbi:MAG: hypothetical protein ACRD2Z_18110, partial [Thermoanaerobaculia bacterium]